MKRAVLILMLATGLMAQPGPGRDMDGQNMEAVRIWKLTEQLELSQEQIASFIPALQIHEREMRKMQRELMTELQDMQTVLLEEEVKQKEATRYLDQFIEHQKKMDAAHLAFIKSLPDYLTPRQQLQFLRFESDFRKHLRKFLQEQRGSMGKHPRNP